MHDRKPETDSPASGLTLPELSLKRYPARITALGSSTTEGIGAASPARGGFVGVMQRALERNVVNGLVVRNRGVGGQNATDLHARIDTVIADAPDLVLFQTGSNDPLQNVPLAVFERLTREDLGRIRRETGADIVLIDQQLCRMLEECPAFPRFLSSLHRIGETEDVPVFPRYRLMQAWCDMPGMDRDTLSPDGLHMAETGYALLGAALSGWLLGGISR